MSSRIIQDCVPELQEAWWKAQEEFKRLYPNMAQPILTCTYRSSEEQDILYFQASDGKDNDKDGKIDEPDECVTHAKGGQSYHNKRPSQAFDITFKNVNGKLVWDIVNFQLFAKIIQKINPKIIWGGSWPAKKRDNPHFEIH